MELQKLRNELVTSNYYLDFKPSFYDDAGKYDLATKTFLFINEIYLKDYSNKPNFIQFDHILFKIPMGVSIKLTKYNAGNVDFIQQYISFKIEKEDLALKMEENKINLRLLFVFNFTQTSEFENFLLGPYIDYHFLTKLQKIIAYNNETGEVYAEFKDIPKPKVATKK